MLPFKEELQDGYKIRTFSEDVDSEELKWHQDQKDRIVKVVESQNWFFQKDNELPIKLEKGQTIFIPKLVWHRVIKGDNNLVVEIKEIED